MKHLAILSHISIRSAALVVCVTALPLAPCHGRAAAKHAPRPAAAAKPRPSAAHAMVPATQAAPSATDRKFAPDAEAKWHYEEGMRLKKLDKMDDAIAQWKEALRIRPDYADVQKEFDLISASSAVHIKHEVGDIKDALTRYSKADTFFDLADILTDRSADEISWYLLNTEREETMYLWQKPPASVNAYLFDMYEDFMKRHHLFAMLPDHSSFDEQGTLVVNPKPDLSGRRLLSALAKWAKRICRSNVEIVMQSPDRLGFVGNKLDDLQYIFRTPDWVEIQGIESIMSVPLEARREGGKWRIGAALGSRLHYQISVRNDRYEKTGGGGR
jgi:hypothetical protein